MSLVLKEKESAKVAADYVGDAIAFCAEMPNHLVEGSINGGLLVSSHLTENAFKVGSLLFIRNAP